MFHKTFTAIVMISVASAFTMANAVEYDLHANLDEAKVQSHGHSVGMPVDNHLDELSRK